MKGIGRRTLFKLATLGAAGSAVAAPTVQRMVGTVPRVATGVRSGWRLLHIDGMALHLPKAARVTQSTYMSEGRQAVYYSIRVGDVTTKVARWATDANSPRSQEWIQQAVNSMFGHLP